MAILADTPIVTQPIPGLTYDEIWIKTFEIVVTGCNGEPAYLNVTFGVVGRDEYGVGVFNQDFVATYHVDDIFANTDPTWQTVMNDVLGLIIEYAQAAGTLVPVLNPTS